ncbi:hypothetical protein BBJ28_00008661 [Nothophytophthora sp. Chile5]|nr:hypothetical protein BBJ28_00008661 [Nothophytophthora sp. Chile5]
MRLTSRGSIQLRSANPRDHPIVDPNYLSTEKDRVDLRNGVRLAREVFAQQAFDELRGDALSPVDSTLLDAVLDAWIRRHAGTVYHPSGTNRMGEGNNTVVNSQMRVHGIEG